MKNLQHFAAGLYCWPQSRYAEEIISFLSVQHRTDLSPQLHFFLTEISGGGDFYRTAMTAARRLPLSIHQCLR